MELDSLNIQSTLEGYQRRHFKPTEIIEAYLQKIESLNPELNALLEIRPEIALDRAKALEDLVQHDRVVVKGNCV